MVVIMRNMTRSMIDDTSLFYSGRRVPFAFLAAVQKDFIPYKSRV